MHWSATSNMFNSDESTAIGPSAWAYMPLHYVHQKILVCFVLTEHIMTYRHDGRQSIVDNYAQVTVVRNKASKRVSYTQGCKRQQKTTRSFSWATSATNQLALSLCDYAWLLKVNTTSNLERDPKHTTLRLRQLLAVYRNQANKSQHRSQN